jgi:hypothetical protein
MKHEDGYCDECGAQLAYGWLTFDGRELCETCAVAGGNQAVRIPAKPNARDDGR